MGEVAVEFDLAVPFEFVLKAVVLLVGWILCSFSLIDVSFLPIQFIHEHRSSES